MYTCYIQSFKSLASFWSLAGLFESYLVAHPEDRFSRDEAQMVYSLAVCLFLLSNFLYVN